MLSNWVYILVADNDSGKTTFQKKLIFYLCGYQYAKLPSNDSHKIVWPRCPQSMPSIFIMGRSLQEKRAVFPTVADYFGKYDEYVDPVCILSSHATGCEIEVQEMIHESQKRLYNVGGVFFENNYDVTRHGQLALLDWDERLWIDNPPASGNGWEKQIDSEARRFAEFLTVRAQAG